MFVVRLVHDIGIHAYIYQSMIKGKENSAVKSEIHPQNDDVKLTLAEDGLHTSLFRYTPSYLTLFELQVLAN